MHLMPSYHSSIPLHSTGLAKNKMAFSYVHRTERLHGFIRVKWRIVFSKKKKGRKKEMEIIFV